VIKRILSLTSILATALLWSAAPASGALRTEIQVLEQGIDRTVVRVEASPRADWASFAIAVPGPTLPVARILSEDSVIAPDPVVSPPSERVVVTQPGLVRGLWTSSVHVALEWETPEGPRRARVLTVVIDHPSRGRAVGPPRQLTGDEEPVSGLFLNSTVAARFANPAQRRAPAFVEDTFARSVNWLRIEIADGGLHALDYPALRSALGSAVDLVDPLSIRIFSAERRIQPTFPSGGGSSWEPARGLREHAIRVEASEATLVPGDRIIMVLAGIGGWSDEYDVSAGWLEHDESTWAVRHSYWMTWDEAGAPAGDFPAPPLRMIEADAAPVGVADRTLDNVRVRTHAEVNAEPGFGNTPDNWMWTSFIGPGESRTHEFMSSSVVSDSVAWVSLRPAAEINGARDELNRQITFFNAEYEISGTPAASVGWARTQQLAPDGYWFRFSYTGLLDGANFLRVRSTTREGANGRDPVLYVDNFNVHWRSHLQPDPDGRISWIIPEYEASTGRWRYQLGDPAGRLDGVAIVDVSVPFAPRWIEPGAGRVSAGAVEFDVAVAGATFAKFMLSTEQGLRRPLRLEQRRPRLLRHEVRQADQSAGVGYEYLALTASNFRSTAEDLGDLRRADLRGVSGSDVAVVDLQDVYDQFGHGAKDPAAIRNFVKFLYEVDPRLEYLALVGDANRDSRGLLPNSFVDYCPTFVESAWPYLPDRGDSRNDSLVPFARDDWFVSLDDPFIRPNNFDLDLPDLAVGRLPVNTPTEAARMLGMLEDYVTAPAEGPWRDSILLAADDEIGGNGTWETYHIEEAEIVAEELLPRSMDRRKLYLTEYVNVGSSRSKPAARQDFIQDWSSGQLIVHYVGHGSPQQLADEVLFRIEDVSALRNGAMRPLFLGLSCDVAIFDDPTVQSMSEALVLQTTGGAIATIAATYVTYVGPNESLTDAVYGRLYPSEPGSLVPRRTLGRSAPVGTALFEAKIIGLPVLSFTRQQNDAKYVILGDPAIRLQSPIEDVSLVGDLAQRIRAGQFEELVGSTPEIDAGNWSLIAAESADSVDYLRADGPGVLKYVLPGNSFFSGRGSFSGSSALASLRTPAVMRLGHAGRVRMLIENGSQMSVGVADSLPVEKGALDTDDNVGPEIEFSNFSIGETLHPGQDLIAVVEDSSGVNVLGSVAANSILAEFDESGVSVDFTDRFVLDDSSYTRGTVRITLPEDISQGSHSLTLSAGDMAGNVTLHDIEFDVVVAVQTGITRHAPFPNPFSGSTRFVVEVRSTLPGAVELTLDLYTVGGAHVESLNASIDGSGRVILPWEGRDRRGDDVANGTYLYVVRARFGGSPPFTETSTGRVVLMR
jgi:hypothetical protein